LCYGIEQLQKHAVTYVALLLTVHLMLVQVKAGVGATGIMLFINTRTNQCCVARLGDSMPFLAASKGAALKAPILTGRLPALELSSQQLLDQLALIELVHACLCCCCCCCCCCFTYCHAKHGAVSQSL
jgi:hypothetical protein